MLLFLCYKERMAKKGRRATDEERFRAVQLMESGKSPELVAEFLGVSRSSVFDWQKKYREGGLAALSTKFASGRPTVLSDKQMMSLYFMIVGKDPRQYSFGFALWTRKIIADLIEQKFGERLSLPTVGRILKKLGMSAQRPLYRAYQQDPEKVRIWKQETYPAIRQQATQAGATIFFADEAGIRTDHHAGTTWAPVGCTPVVTATGQRKSVNMISAISPRGHLHFDLFEGSMTAARFIEFCTKLVHDCPQTFSWCALMFVGRDMVLFPDGFGGGRGGWSSGVWLGGCWGGWYPGFSLEGVAEDGHHVESVLGCGGEDPADCVAVLGAVFAGEAPGDVLLDFGWP